MRGLILLIVLTLSILLNLFLCTEYFQNNNTITLSLLDIFFITTALTSIVFNILQWRDSQTKNRPLKSMLMGLFNDIKQKQMHAYTVQNLLYHPDNPHEKIDTMKSAFNDYIYTIIHALEGFRETTTGILVSIDPQDREGKETFKAADYGLTEQQKIKRDEFIFKNMEKTIPNS